MTQLLSRLYFVSKADELLGGMWAVIATIFVNRASYEQSLAAAAAASRLAAAAAASRMAATSVSFIICLIYLLFLPFHSWALAVLIGVSALVVLPLGRPQDAITAAITTTVVMVVASVSPQHAWQQPILRFADASRRLARPARDPRQSRANQVTRGPRAPTHSATPGVHFQVGVVPQGAHRQQRAAPSSLEPVYGPLVAPVRPGARHDRMELIGRRS